MEFMRKACLDTNNRPSALVAVIIYSNAGLPPIGIRDLHPYFAVSREILSPLPLHIITTSGFSVIRQLLFQGPSVLHTRAECLFVQSSARSADPGNAAWALRSIPTTEFAIAQKQNRPFGRFCFCAMEVVGIEPTSKVVWQKGLHDCRVFSTHRSKTRRRR